MKSTLVTRLSFALCAFAFVARVNAHIPVEDFFAEPEVRSVSVSPDGKHIAWLSPIDGTVSLILFSLDTGRPEILAHPTDDNIKVFFWKGSDRIVYGGDLGGNESQALISVDLKTRQFVHLADSYRENVNDDAATAQIVDGLKFDPNHILIFGRSSRGGRSVQLSLLDVRNGDRVSVGGGDPFTNDWVVDNTGAIRARNRRDGDKIIFEASSDARSLPKSVGETPSSLGTYMKLYEPHGFNADNEILYISKYPADKPGCSLFAYNTRTRQWGEPLLTVEDGDIVIHLSWDRSKLLGVTQLTEERPKTTWFDPAREKLMRQISGSVPAGLVSSITSTSQDEKVVVVNARSDTNPGIYFLLDLRGKPQFVQLGRVNPKLDPTQLQPMKPITYPARDGLEIHGYLTLPRGSEGKRVPLVINPHGGPFSIRDSWGYGLGEAAFLADRGYAVLQPNYRGSGGYGAAFLKAGQREWGGKMQNDLSDAVKWAIDQGIADPKRVCIYGASYGGYAALAGVTFTPELYCCGINYVGVSDLSIITSPGRMIGEEADVYRKVWVGIDHDILFNRSPVNFVQNIRVPTLHAYGENDPRVIMKNWTELEAELKKYNKPYEFSREDNEGHGFRHESARIAFYKKMERFLATNLAPETAGSVQIGDVKTIAMPAK